MRIEKALLRHILATVVVFGVVFAPANATTLVRESMEDLVDTHGTIVVGQVLDVRSYWNEDGTFILTDVLVATDEVLKGEQDAGELTFTVMGGTVGDVTTLIVGGAELVPGSSYVLFLDEADLPGAKGRLTVRDHCQGAFDVVLDKQGNLRAVSQANQHPLVPDSQGYFDAPGGVAGFPFEAMTQSIRDRVQKEVR